MFHGNTSKSHFNLILCLWTHDNDNNIFQCNIILIQILTF